MLMSSMCAAYVHVQVALTDSQYMLVIRGIAVKNMLSRVGLAKGTHGA